jgi:hypothetical protein
MREKIYCKICGDTGFVRDGKIIRNCPECNTPARPTIPKITLAEIINKNTKGEKKGKVVWTKEKKLDDDL